ncbi:MAG: hypothetical protein IKV35_07040 [Clostridia bacterium]|nr:hypothetical protein [Clostridia bacterium]
MVIDNVSEGRENIAVNDDGSWTATGMFTLVVDAAYDYRLVNYSLSIEMETDTAFDIAMTLQTTDTDRYNVLFNEERFGDVPITAEDNGEELSLSVGAVYQWHIMYDGWKEDGDPSVEYRTLSYQPADEGSTTFYNIGHLTTDPFTFGDVSEDGTVNMMDIIAMYNGISGDNAIPKAKTERWDIDRNGTINTLDILRLYNAVSGN